MDVTELQHRLAADEALAPHADYLLGIARPCVNIELAGQTTAAAVSRFGGQPCVPAGFQWPSHPAGRYRFLGQINFAEIADAPSLLPRSGLLALFYAEDVDGDEVFWQDEGYVQGFYWPDHADHVLMPCPTGDDIPAWQITLQSGVDLPLFDVLRDDWPEDPEMLTDGICDIVRGGDVIHNYLLGYPSYCTLCYDPAPPGWISLLTVFSLPELQWCWHDGDKLMVFIEPDKLQRADFSHLKSDAG
ncbi:hypothetical protein IGB42_02425 [Andreprevotia sp. IGB-42]|nr:hypothetical protein IGB42_02425 [Andreprevotia sp. IGB-42]